MAPYWAASQADLHLRPATRASQWLFHRHGSQRRVHDHFGSAQSSPKGSSGVFFFLLGREGVVWSMRCLKHVETRSKDI